ncbi:MAG: primosomal protein N', partial [Deltaproteobacteria bacterium]|nr:primosomal protein N' [Deltaproteobacteria bacterium]
GVTGSGKTEVYLHLVRKTLSLGKSCLILVPEIALTAQMVNRFRSRFGDQVAVLHSAMGEARRFAEWNRVRRGAAPIVVGARSALFAPLQNLGLVVVDEEHDPSYKQDDTPRYQARDTALVRARFNGALAVLGSATPSMESLRNAALGKLVHLVLSHRVNNRPLPRVELLHLKAVPRQPGSLLFTRTLVEAIRQNLLKKEQTLIFLNRRGFANLVRCEACQEPVVCPNCSLTLVYHQARESLRCHRCDHQQPHPVQCPACRGGPMKVLGVGTERLEEELGVMFPQARLLRMDSDSLSRRGELERLLEGIRLNRYDIIIGTQILTKGHDFPNISLVAAVLADLSLNLPDFRAGERTFQLLTQMAGRAGRGSIPGQVLIQTYNPLHHSLVHVQTHDTAGFTRVELPIREKSGAPPYTHQAMVWVSGPDEAKTLALARQVGFLLQRHSPAGVLVMGPAEPPIRKVAGRYRQMVALRHPQPGALLRGLKSALEDPVLKPGPNQRIVVDMDAHNLM